jgi:hypothetical protein
VPGWVRGFQTPARKKLSVHPASPAAVWRSWSSDSALHGPAHRNMPGIGSPHRAKGVMLPLIIFRLLTPPRAGL